MTDIFYTLEILIYYTKDQFIVSVAMIKSAIFFRYLPIMGKELMVSASMPRMTLRSRSNKGF